ncbi:MAG: hypothetical protein V2I33_19930, partial [Kangiellaceae bacterium]|nr:hypothetical protein [Kangiellaceae bacterium]
FYHVNTLILVVGIGTIIKAAEGNADVDSYDDALRNAFTGEYAFILVAGVLTCTFVSLGLWYCMHMVNSF